jgi:hypothetical protein
LIDADVALERVALLLGYINLDTTRIYTTLGEDLENAITELEHYNFCINANYPGLLFAGVD